MMGLKSVLVFLTFLCVCVHTHTRRGQRTVFRSLFSPTTWVPETELRWSDVVAFPETSYLSFLELDNVSPLGRGVILAHRPLQSVSGPCVPYIVYGHYFYHVHYLLYKMCVYPVTGCGEQHRC